MTELYFWELAILGLLGIVLALLALWTAHLAFYIWPMFRGAVFVPSADDKLASMLQLARLKPTDVVADLGSGDGKVVLAVAGRGVSRVVGYEINPLLVRRARRAIAQAGWQEAAHILDQSLWEADLSGYDVLFLYGTTYIMKRLEKKLRAELKPGARVISNYFQFPTWQPAAEENQVRLYLQPENTV